LCAERRACSVDQPVQNAVDRLAAQAPRFGFGLIQQQRVLLRREAERACEAGVCHGGLLLLDDVHSL
jgi:hypothetical protein